MLQHAVNRALCCGRASLLNFVHVGSQNYTNSFDVMLRGQEIASGAQRVHDPDLLVQRMQELNVDPTPFQAYIDSFRYGAWPHGGAGFGLERIVRSLSPCP